MKKPMLALSHDKVKNPDYTGWYASPKIDGLRATVQRREDGKIRLFSRSLKEHANINVQEEFSHPDLLLLDGELVVDNNFHRSSGLLRSHTAKANVTFNVFDILMDGPFSERLNYLMSIKDKILSHHPNVRFVSQFTCFGNNINWLARSFVEKGYEGVCLRRPDGCYKQGRPGQVNPELVKHKPLRRAVGWVIGTTFLQRNHNEQTVSETGHLKRSHKQEGKVVDHSRLGSLVVVNEDFSEAFHVGSGFTDEERLTFSDHKKVFHHSVVFEYQPIGSTKERPRCPIFKKLSLQPNSLL